jgi:hypothetical protein
LLVVAKGYTFNEQEGQKNHEFCAFPNEHTWGYMAYCEKCGKNVSHCRYNCVNGVHYDVIPAQKPPKKRNLFQRIIDWFRVGGNKKAWPKSGFSGDCWCSVSEDNKHRTCFVS